MTKVLIWPRPTEQPANHGIGRVVHAQYKHLPHYGIQLVDDPERADVVAIHAGKNPFKRVEVLHAHGLYWTGDKGSGVYTQWHSDANKGIIDMARSACAITVPSEWVAMPFKRDMRISPHVIGHGIELGEWTPGESAGYVLWGKNRPGDVCDPTPAYDLAHLGVKVVSTFAPENNLQLPGSLTVTGSLTHEKMREYLRSADVYLATVKETFGIQTLEAMACGVPVLGYNHGGTADIVRHGIDGYLTRPGDVDDLLRGLDWIRVRRAELSANAREHARSFTWERVAERYAELYQRIASTPEPTGVSVIVVSYNYGKYLGQALDSLLGQSYKVDEIIVVDDGSTDDTGRIAARYKAQGVRYVRQENQGVAYARNHGVSIATQPFIICLDADDYLHPRYVEVTRAEMLRDRSLGIAYTGLVVFNDDDPHGQRSGWPPEFSWESQATVHTPPSSCVPSAAMFRRSMWERAGGYRQEHKPAEDTEFWTRGLSVGFNAKRVTDNPWFNYRSHPGSASRSNKYSPIDALLPWMRDKDWPLAAPAKETARPRSYSTPKVSVIIPVGPGHAKYLPQALDSLLGQTMREWQAIIVNDSGGDLPLKSYPFARVIDIGTNHGAGEARNEGVHFSDAPLVFFLDADDYLHADALAKLCQAYAGSGGRYIYGDWTELSGKQQTEIESPRYDVGAWLDFNHMEGKHIVSVLMATEDARAIRFDESLPFWEDWDFFARCAIAGIHGKHISEPTVVVRRHTGTRTREAFSSNGNAGPVLATLRMRYDAYTKGTLMAKSCCGGNGEALMAARLAYDGTPLDMGGLSVNITTKNGRLENMTNPQGGPSDGIAPVRMEFTGERQGAVTYYGVQGRSYRGGNNSLERYINAHPDDAAKLASTGDWKVIGAPVLPEITDILQEKREAREQVAVTELEDVEVTFKKVDTGEGVITKKRVKPKKEKESKLLDLPEQE